MNNFKLVTDNENIAIEQNNPKKIKTKGLDFEKIMARAIKFKLKEDNAQRIPVDKSPIEQEKLEATREFEVPRPEAVVKEQSPSKEISKKEEPNISAWRDPLTNEPRKSTVIDTIPSIAIGESAKEQYNGLLNKLDPKEDKFSYAVVESGLSKVQKEEQEKAKLVEGRNNGEREFETMVTEKNSQIEELKAKYEAELRKLEDEKNKLNNQGQQFIKDISDKIKDKDNKIISIYKDMKDALSKAEAADKTAKEAESLVLRQREIVGDINPEFLTSLDGINEPEEPKKPIDVFTALRVEDKGRRAA